MWDSNAPLQLLKSMPKKLSRENLEKIQMVIDADKYKNSLISGFDLCGMYAPFCRDCKKTSIFPCALAYINMLKAEGMDVEIDAKPLNGAVSKNFTSPQPPVAQSPVPVPEQVKEEIAVTSVAEEVKTEVEEKTEVVEPEQVTPVKEVEPELPQEPVTVDEQEPVKEQPTKPATKIRIAVARKKIL